MRTGRIHRQNVDAIRRTHAGGHLVVSVNLQTESRRLRLGILCVRFYAQEHKSNDPRDRHPSNSGSRVLLSVYGRDSHECEPPFSLPGRAAEHVSLRTNEQSCVSEFPLQGTSGPCIHHAAPPIQVYFLKCGRKRARETGHPNRKTVCYHAEDRSPGDRSV